MSKTLGIFAEPATREPRSHRNEIYWAVCGDFPGGPERRCKDRAEAVVFAKERNAIKPRSTAAGIMEVRNGETWSWEPIT